jgi:diamine N-acetyltransferase
MSNELMKGSNVRLRAVEPGDVDFILQIENDPLAWQAGNTVVPFSRFQIEQYVLTTQHNIFADKQLRLMIDTIRQSPVRTIGCIDLFDFDPIHKRAGIGIIITEEERGKGYAAESLGLLIRYCTEILMLHQLYCNISPDNARSLRLFKKHGFVRCGIKKDWRFKEGKWTDEIMFQRINK